MLILRGQSLWLKRDHFGLGRNLLLSLVFNLGAFQPFWEPVVQENNRTPLLVLFKNILDLLDILYVIDYLAGVGPAIL